MQNRNCSPATAHELAVHVTGDSADKHTSIVDKGKACTHASMHAKCEDWSLFGDHEVAVHIWQQLQQYRPLYYG